MLRHQLNVYQPSTAAEASHGGPLTLGLGLGSGQAGREELTLVKPATVIAWQCKPFRDY